MTDAARYLLAVYTAQRAGIDPVPSGRIADAVGKSPSATTEMVQRLEARGLLAYEPYAGVTLTEAGHDAAAELAETYAIFVRFFRDVLELEDPHREALAVTGHVSSEIADRLAVSLLDSSARTDAVLNEAPFALRVDSNPDHRA
jgi:Mn-dependent DtxR family transcriptional regulator